MLLYKDDPLIKAESMEILLVKLGPWKYWREKTLHVSIIYEVILSGPLSSSAPNAVSQHYLIMEDGGGST